MDFITLQRQFEEELRRDPKAAPPVMPQGLVTREDVERFHQWKVACRAHDAALMALGLVAPQEMQERNAAVRPGKHGGRVVRHEQYV